MYNDSVFMDNVYTFPKVTFRRTVSELVDSFIDVVNNVQC